nr:CvpA family protein [Natranaerofaba carboxydovora]
MFFAVFQGAKLGFVYQLFSVLQLLAAYIISVSYFQELSDFFNEVLNLGGFLEGSILVNIAAFLILFFVTKTLISFVGGIIGISTFLPVVSTLNRVLGGAFGLIKGIIVVMIVMAIMFVLPWGFFQESLWESQVFLFWLEFWPKIILMFI